MKPWREVAVPHYDVLSKDFQQSEFAADISSFRGDDAPSLYRDAATFFERTFITEGMGLLLVQVAQRLNGRGGEPVIQLQTSFGGGKTHTMLAVYHLAQRDVPLTKLAGLSTLLDRAGLMEVPRATVAILDGTAHAPDKVTRFGDTEVRTLWGHLAWQLGRAEGFEMVRRADASGTSPGKETLRDLLRAHSPCVILVDELVAYVRQFGDGQVLAGGSYNSNLSFVQELTEAVKQVPNAILLASLPESELEVGDSKGKSTLAALEKLFGRVQAVWKPVTAEESYEIVRRRLFEPIRDVATRDAVCREFARTYEAEGTRVPSETHESRYFEKMVRAYPIHPDVFGRLYEDWSTLDGFQRTRGVLKLMARVIQRLWKAQNKDLMILPASLPLDDGATRNELTYYLSPGWDAVISRDIDGEGSECAEIDTKETRFGAVHAAKRVARTLFLGSAPSAGGMKPGTRGIDRARVLLGCLQPDQASAVYSDALDRLADRLHYLNASGERGDETTRYWFDVRANLRREMEDRKARFDDAKDVRPRVFELVTQVLASRTLFEGTHVFTAHADVPDDSALRLVVLSPERRYSKPEASLVFEAAAEYVRSNGSKPRFRGNRLVFLVADASVLGRLQDGVRAALAWESIVADVDKGRLVIDVMQQKQAKKEAEAAQSLALRAARECFRWVVAPTMAAATDREVKFDAYMLNTSGTAFAAELERVCVENEIVVKAWSPIHLRTRLKELYWKDGRSSVPALSVWEDMQKFLYLPRLKDRAVLEATIQQGAKSTDFFGTAYGERDGRFEGFHLGGGGVQVDATLLLIEPGAAKAWQEAQARAVEAPQGTATETSVPGESAATRKPDGPTAKPAAGLSTVAAAKATTFFGAVDVNAATAKLKLGVLAEEIISVLASDPHATVKVTVEISAEFPNGAPDHVKRAVSENAAQLGFKSKDWE